MMNHCNKHYFNRTVVTGNWKLGIGSMNIVAQINSILAALILLTAFGLLVQRRIYGLLHLFAWQGLFLSISTAVVGFVAEKHHLYISSLLTLVLKVIVLPYILHVLIMRLKIRKEIDTVVNVPTTMLIGIVIVIFSYSLTRSEERRVGKEGRSRR